MPTLESIGRDLLGTLTSIVTGGDQNVAADKAFRIVWCQPGIPFTENDFQFASTTTNGTLTPTQVDNNERQRYNFSMAVDFIPSTTGVLSSDAQSAVYRPDGTRLSTMYGMILSASRVISKPLTAEEQKKLSSAESYLRSTKKDFDDTIVAEDSLALMQYNACQNDYDTAMLNLRYLETSAASLTGEAGVTAKYQLINTGAILTAKIKSALTRWSSHGNKLSVEKAQNLLLAYSERSFSTLKTKWLSEFNIQTSKTALNVGGTYAPATPIPSNFATSGNWTNYYYHSKDYKKKTDWSSSSWGGSGGINFGFWRTGGSAGGTNSWESELETLDEIEISFEMTQVLIARNWFVPEFLLSRGWTVQQGAEWPFAELVSNGQSSPGGVLPAYPSVAIFAKNLVIKSSRFVEIWEAHRESINAGGCGGWGPFSFGGNYSRASGGTQFEVDLEEGKITFKGMQLIGLLCRVLPKRPDLLPGTSLADYQ